MVSFVIIAYLLKNKKEKRKEKAFVSVQYRKVILQKRAWFDVGAQK